MSATVEGLELLLSSSLLTFLLGLMKIDYEFIK